MPDPNPAADEHGAAIRQAAILAMVVALVGITTAVALWCVRHDEILLPSRMAEWRKTKANYRYCGFYDTAEDRFLNEVLPDADYSRGGVYLLGASGMQTSVAMWERPESEQRFIHNYGFSGLTFTQEFQFVRFLVEQRGLLRAGGDKTSVIVGASFTDTAHLTTLDARRYSLRTFLVKSKFYTYDLEDGIKPIRMPSWLRWFRRERIRRYAFWSWAGKVALEGGEGLRYLEPVVHRPAGVVRKFWLDWMGADWEKGMDTEFDQLSRMIDYLQARKVNVSAVYLPTESWTKGFPPVERYRRKLLDLFASKAVPVTDLANTVDDNDFQDSVHLGYFGERKTEPAILAVAQGFMRSGSTPR